MWSLKGLNPRSRLPKHWRFHLDNVAADSLVARLVPQCSSGLLWLADGQPSPSAVRQLPEYAPPPSAETKKKDVVWFAINDDRPLTCFVGIWTEFKGDRGTKSKPIPHQVYGFLTTSPNAVIEPTHPKAMPVILMTRSATSGLG